MQLNAPDDAFLNSHQPTFFLEGKADASHFRSLGPAVALDAVGARVDAYLAKHFRFLSRSGWQKRIAQGQLLVNERRTRVSARLKVGDRLTMYSPPQVEPEVDASVRCLWQGDGVMALYKPGHLPMHENGPYRKNTFTQIVWDRFGRQWSAVHRLDRETSGIVLCGSTSLVRAQLSRDFENRKVEKEYLAIARGVPPSKAPKWVADGPIGDLEDSAIRIKRWVVPGGQYAMTEFLILDTASEAVLLKAWPKTGRTNQIRIHAAHAGLPLYGDKLYHEDEAVFLEFFEHGPTANVIRRTGFSRVCLHAHALTFKHPITGDMVRVECPLPPDLEDFWNGLKANG